MIDGPADLDPRLGWLAEQLWPVWSRPPVGVHVGSPPPADRRVVERYLVVPSRRRARFLVPLVSHRTAVASLARYNALREGRIRVYRSLLATAIAAPGGRRWLGDPLMVSLPAAEEARRPDLLLGSHIGRVLGTAPPATAVGVHAPDPNHKPTLQLFDDRGAPLGYVKLGWNDATRRLVDNEAAALVRVGPLLAGGPLSVPGLLHAGSWHDHRLLVTRPLPTGVRHWRGDQPPGPEVTLAVAATGPDRRTELTGTEYWRGVRQRVAAARLAEHGPLLRSCTERLAAATAGRPLRMTGWHGDWVPWNLARGAGGRLHVWDWEHATAEAPLGLDLLHWHFQVELVMRGKDAAAAAAYAQRRAHPQLRELGLSEEECRLVTTLYLLEMELRGCDLERAGGGWNPALHPALLLELGRRTAAL